MVACSASDCAAVISSYGVSFITFTPSISEKYCLDNCNYLGYP